MVSAGTAGLTAGVFDKWTNTQTEVGNTVQNGVKVASEGGLSSWSGIGSFAGNQLLQDGTSTLLDRALGGNAKLSDALQNSLANTFAAAGFNFVGDITAPDQLNWAEGSLAKIGLHAVMGGLAAEAAGGDFRTGALAAGVNEALVDSLAKQYAGMDPEQKKGLLVMNSQLIGVLAASMQGNADADSVQTGAQVAGSATQYNFLLHEEIQARAKEIKGCGGSDDCEQDVIQRYAALDKARNDDLPGLCQASPDQCMGLMKQLASERGLNAAAIDSLRFEDVNAAMGMQLASESNEEAISTIQLELIRNKYGDGTAIAAQIFQIAAAGSLAKNAKSGVVPKGAATWKGSGPTPGVLGLEPGSASSKAIQNYYPSTKSGSIEFVFDTKTQTFAVGKPSSTTPGLSPHEQLAKSIGSSGSGSVVGGMFKRGPNGEFITNEFSGHYWQNWSPETRSAFEKAMSGYGVKVEHRPGM